VDAAWQANHEHPSLMKSLFALSYEWLHTRWHLIADASTAFRLPGMLMMGLALWVTYLFAARAYGHRAGLLAAGLLGLAPNVFYNAHLACFDVPIMAMWVTCIYVYWRAEATGGRWAILAGVVFGLTLETKHNAWMLPAVFLPHALLVHHASISRHLRVGRVPIPASLVSMALLGPLVFVGLWPWLWNDTLPRVQEYVNFHLNHEYYNIEFLGKNYFGPPSPRAYAPVMIAATIPSVTLLLFLVGGLDRVRVLALRLASWLAGALRRASPVSPPPKDRLETDVLVLLGFAVPLAVFFLPRTPIFGGTKHWFPAYPFLAILAGRGFDLVATRLEAALGERVEVRLRRAAHAALAALVLAGPILVTRHSHPFGLSAYVPFVGGTAGGADLGLNRQFWGFTTQSLAPYFARTAPQGATVFIHDTAWDSWARMIDEKRLRPDLRGVGTPSEADFSIVHHELHMAEIDYNIWVEYAKATPDHVLLHDGVPIVSVYRK
jgi:hypothetical protein